MTDILLALCVGAAFALGYLPVRRLDRFLEKNRAAAEGRRADANPPAPGRAPGRGFALRGSWRGGLLPLRHRG